jgi:hypothetical protein
MWLSFLEWRERTRVMASTLSIGPNLPRAKSPEPRESDILRSTRGVHHVMTVLRGSPYPEWIIYILLATELCGTWSWGHTNPCSEADMETPGLPSSSLSLFQS